VGGRKERKKKEERKRERERERYVKSLANGNRNYPTLPLIKSPVVFTSSDLTFNHILRKINV